MIERFDNNKHFVNIATWYYQWGLKIPQQEFMPKYGWVIDDNMAAFIVQTDTLYCFLEYLISNPKSTKLERKELSKKLLDYMVIEAKKLGYQKIIVTATHPGTLAILDNNEFIEKPTSFLMRDI